MKKLPRCDRQSNEDKHGNGQLTSATPAYGGAGTSPYASAVGLCRRDFGWSTRRRLGCLLDLSQQMMTSGKADFASEGFDCLHLHGAGLYSASSLLT